MSSSHRFSLRTAAASLRGRGRTLLLPLLAVAIAVLIFCIEAPHGRPAGGRIEVPDGYVALVNQQGVLRSDLVSQTEMETGQSFGEVSASERARVLHEMIDKELLVQRALALDVPRNASSVASVMGDAVAAQAAAPTLAQEPTEAQLRAYYEAHHTRYSSLGTMTVRDLVLHVGGYQNADQTVAQAQADAIEAVLQLREGRPIAYIMEHYGFVDADPEYDGLQLDFAARIHLGPKLYQVATTLSSGDVSDPIVDNNGVHILIMLQRQAPSVETFATARATVYNDYRLAQREHAASQNLKLLRSQAQILLAPGLSD